MLVNYPPPPEEIRKNLSHPRFFLLQTIKFTRLRQEKRAHFETNISIISRLKPYPKIKLKFE